MQQGVDLVEVTSHPGARPSHAEWQGRCYSRSGQKTIDGTVYPDFRSSTGYGTGPGLCGWNCRHSFGPYRHGAPHAYDPDPKSETGLPNDEVYALTQRQRAKERQIRSAKRELRGAQQVYGSDKSTESLAAVNAAKAKLRKRQSEMRDLVDTSNARCKPGTQVMHRNPKREWAGDMPDVKTAARTGGANRKIYIGKSLGARARNFEVGMPGNEKSKFVEGSEIEEKCIFAGKDAETGNELKKRFKLAAEYGGNPEDWSHVSGNGWLYDPALNGKIRLAEVHWMQNTEIDEYQEFWFKKWIDDD